jgi:hypothetical protein
MLRSKRSFLNTAPRNLAIYQQCYCLWSYLIRVPPSPQDLGRNLSIENSPIREMSSLRFFSPEQTKFSNASPVGKRVRRDTSSAVFTRRRR